jgi:tetratricopeptide (TPR) repeat protein
MAVRRHRRYDVLVEAWRNLPQALVLLAGLISAACTPHAGRGSALYGEGRYVEAAEVFERTEHRLPSASPDEQAEYGLYRGLTLLELGDHGRAREWLAFARQAETRSPGALGSHELALLQTAWRRLEQADGEQPRHADDRALAATRIERTPPAVRGTNGRRHVPVSESATR